MSPSVSGPSRKARAFAPGHVTGLFAPSTGARDPRARGSLGAGIVLEAGVTADAEWRPGPRLRVRLTSDLERRLEISEEVARRLVPPSTGTLSVTLRHSFPLGQGFGTSASGALATALAVAQVTGRSRSRAVEVAHLADLFGGGGLGGVAAILGGGLEVRVRPGIPPFGKVLRRPFLDSVLLGIAGSPIPSPTVLNDRKALARIAAAAAGLDALTQDPSPERFWDASEAFTDRAWPRPPGAPGPAAGAPEARSPGRPGDVRTELLCAVSPRRAASRPPPMDRSTRGARARAVGRVEGGLPVTPSVAGGLSASGRRRGGCAPPQAFSGRRSLGRFHDAQTGPHVPGDRGPGVHSPRVHGRGPGTVASRSSTRATSGRHSRGP